MESYSIEDIELIRKKSGLSYQDAVALLDFHNGSAARALIDLEKSGRLQTGENEISVAGEKAQGGEKKEKALSFLQKLYRSRIKVSKGETPVVNLSVLFGAATLIFAPHLTIAGIIISLILGYKFSFTGNDEAFASENLEKMVRNAAQNAKSSVSDAMQKMNIQVELNKDGSKKKADASVKPKAEKQEIPKNEAAGSMPVRSLSADPDGRDNPAEDLKRQAKELENTMDSFFSSNPAATTYHSAYSAMASSVPTLQIPTQAESQEGEVQADVREGGSSSAGIG